MPQYPVMNVSTSSLTFLLQMKKQEELVIMAYKAIHLIFLHSKGFCYFSSLILDFNCFFFC